MRTDLAAMVKAALEAESQETVSAKSVSEEDQGLEPTKEDQLGSSVSGKGLADAYQSSLVEEYENTMQKEWVNCEMQHLATIRGQHCSVEGKQLDKKCAFNQRCFKCTSCADASEWPVCSMYDAGPGKDTCKNGQVADNGIPIPALVPVLTRSPRISKDAQVSSNEPVLTRSPRISKDAQVLSSEPVLTRSPRISKDAQVPSSGPVLTRSPPITDRSALLEDASQDLADRSFLSVKPECSECISDCAPTEAEQRVQHMFDCARIVCGDKCTPEEIDMSEQAAKENEAVVDESHGAEPSYERGEAAAVAAGIGKVLHSNESWHKPQVHEAVVPGAEMANRANICCMAPYVNLNTIERNFGGIANNIKLKKGKTCKDGLFGRATFKHQLPDFCCEGRDLEHPTSTFGAKMTKLQKLYCIVYVGCRMSNVVEEHEKVQQMYRKEHRRPIRLTHLCNELDQVDSLNMPDKAALKAAFKNAEKAYSKVFDSFNQLQIQQGLRPEAAYDKNSTKKAFWQGVHEG